MRRESDDDVKKHLGEQLRAARTRIGLAQADVAQRAGLSSEVYGRMERGGVGCSIYLMRKLCLVLNVTPNTLLGIGPVELIEAINTQPKGPLHVAGNTRRDRLLRQLERRVNGLTAKSIAALLRVAANLRGEPAEAPSAPRSE